MDALDYILIVIILAAAIRGLRLGAAVQVLSYGGALGGLAVGVVLVLLICPHVSGEHAKTFVALLLLLVPAAVLAAAGRHVGAGLWRRLRRARFGSVDAAGGAIVAVGGLVVVLWVVASILVNSQFTLVSDQIEVLGSSGRHGCHAADPDGAGAGQAVPERRGPATRRRQIIQLAGPVAYPTSGQVQAAVKIARPSTVKVVALGCGEEQEGSGFIVAHDLVVTNAHVVAGTNSISVFDAAGMDHTDVSVLLFDPEFDLAVLRVPGLPGPALSLDPNLVGRGARAVVLGYPEGGPFAVDRAGVRSEILATGLDIYGEQPTVRAVYVV